MTALLLLFGALSVVTAGEAAADEPIAGTPADALSIPYEKYVLPENGLEVILHENHTLPIVSVNIWYHTGPINEEPGRTGFAHLFEHLMFQGSRNVGDDAHLKILESVGASQINGTTGYDRTNYFQTVPANQLELVLWLESDRMGFLLDALTLDKLQNQREVVKNERRQTTDNRPYGPSYEKFIQTLFEPGHPYHGVIIGSMEDLEAASLEDVQNFFTRYYSPANASLVIAGDIDVEQTKAWVQKYFGTLPARERPAPRQVETKPITSQRRVEVKEPVMLPKLQIGWHSPPFLTEGDAEADVLAHILGGGKSSRLHRKLVYELELAQSVAVYQQSNQLASIFSVAITGRPGVDRAKLEKVVWEELEKLEKGGVSEREVIRARNVLLTQSIAALQQIGTVADRLNGYNHYLGKPGYFQEDLARYERITPADLQTFAQTQLNPDRAVVVHTVPETAGAQSAGPQPLPSEDSAGSAHVGTPNRAPQGRSKPERGDRA